MDYIKDIEHDEIRDGFLVTQSRKKIWNKSLEIWSFFDNICRKYNIRYYADYGTLLGAVRHKGFIPWDDDLDFVMFRPEYERFLQCAAKELKEPYFLQTTYTDIKISAFAKIRDSRTTAVEDRNDLISNQGMFLDVFPLDGVPAGEGDDYKALLIERDLWLILTNESYVRQALVQGSFHINEATARKILEMTKEERMRVFEDFCQSHYSAAERVNFITDELIGRDNYTCRSWYDEVVYLPFEQVKLPAPKEYVKILERRYGNYHEYVHCLSDHEGIELSADIPYTRYLREIAGNCYGEEKL